MKFILKEAIKQSYMQEDVVTPCVVEGQLSECGLFAVVEPGEMAKVGSKKTTESIFMIGYEADIYRKEESRDSAMDKVDSVVGDITMWALMVIILSAALLVVSVRGHAAEATGVMLDDHVVHNSLPADPSITTAEHSLTDNNGGSHGK